MKLIQHILAHFDVSIGHQDYICHCHEEQPQSELTRNFMFSINFMRFIRISPKILTKIEGIFISIVSWIILPLYEDFPVFLPNTQILYFLFMFTLVRVRSHSLCVHCLRKLDIFFFTDTFIVSISYIKSFTCSNFQHLQNIPKHIFSFYFIRVHTRN